MPDHGWKIGLCLFTLFASVAILLLGPPLKLGIDLRGGALLVYEVDQSQKKLGESVDMDKLIGAIARRVNPGGQKEVTVRKYGKEGIEIIVPEQDEAEVARIERSISRAGSLEFRILANRRDNKLIIEACRDRALEDADNRWQGESAGVVGASDRRGTGKFQEGLRNRLPDADDGRSQRHGSPCG